MTEKYNINDLIKLISEDKSSKEIHKIYGQKTNKEHLDEFLDIKTNNGWKRTSLENF